jgi:hypothetical protein
MPDKFSVSFIDDEGSITVPKSVRPKVIMSQYQQFRVNLYALCRTNLVCHSLTMKGASLYLSL